MPSSRSLAQVSRDISGWLLVTTLFYAPWNFGSTGAAAIRILNWLLVAVIFFWLLGTVIASFSREVVRFCYWPLLLMGLALLVIGWGMTANAHAVVDNDYAFFLPLTSPWPAAPGSSAYALSLYFMRRITLLLGTIWIVADLVQEPKWLLRLLWAIGLAGGSIALLGLVQKATGAQLPLWQAIEPGESPVTTFFATYYYHGNAGAYLNLILPAVLGLAGRYLARPANPGSRALWVALSLVTVVAVFSDTSRMGQAIAVLILLALLFISAPTTFRRVRHAEARTVLIAIIAGVAALWAVTQASHLDRSIGRWEQFKSSTTHDARWVVDQVALKAMPQAGLVGFGPATFSEVFPKLDPQLAKDAPGEWLFLHDDYLQTFLEWGWLGGLLWGAVFFGGIYAALRGLRSARRRPHWSPRQRALLPLAIIALGGVALHAVVDFPLQISSIQLYVATYLGICWGSREWGSRQS